MNAPKKAALTIYEIWADPKNLFDIGAEEDYLPNIPGLKTQRTSHYGWCLTHMTIAVLCYFLAEKDVKWLNFPNRHIADMSRVFARLFWENAVLNKDALIRALIIYADAVGRLPMDWNENDSD